MSTNAKPLNRQTIASVGEAFAVLGITGSISDEEEIHAAFRKSVREAADGTGGYQRDMDLLVQAKAFLLEALARVREQASRDRARAFEKQEREHTRQKQQTHAQQRAKANTKEAEQKEEQAREPSRLEGPTGEPEPQESHKSTEEPPPQDDKAQKAANGSQGNGNTDTIEATLRAIMAQLTEIEQQRTKEREQARRQEQAHAQAYKALASHLDELERVVRVIRTSLEGEEDAPSCN